MIFGKILSNNDVENLQINLNRLGEWAFENEMIINPVKSKAVCVAKAPATESLNYSLANSCEYLGIILCSDLSCADQNDCAVKEAWKALRFTMCILKKGNSSTISLAYTSLVRPVLACASSCWAT
jgi:hypothetical protein